jgi:uncharacterized OB-fold protein
MEKYLENALLSISRRKAKKENKDEPYILLHNGKVLLTGHKCWACGSVYSNSFAQCPGCDNNH